MESQRRHLLMHCPRKAPGAVPRTNVAVGTADGANSCDAEALALVGKPVSEQSSYSISKSPLTLLLRLAVLQHCLRLRA
jgi:hypothetical protein